MSNKRMQREKIRDKQSAIGRDYQDLTTTFGRGKVYKQKASARNFLLAREFPFPIS
jgi:hypothetical protein